MKYTIPDFYKEFECIADKCPDTCCAGWQIMIDDQAMEQYRKVPGGLGNRLHNSINEDEGCFCQYNGRCAFLNEENLCDLYLEGGENLFCRTCRTYPRHIEEFENVREISLAISCPEAARLLLNRKEPLRFQQIEVEKPLEAYEKFNHRLYALLQQSREVMIQLLQDRSWGIRERMGTVLALGHDLGIRVRNRRLHQIPSLLKQYRLDGINCYIRQHPSTGKERKVVMHRVFQLLYQMETLEPEWMPFVRQIDAALYQKGEDAYREMTQEWLDPVVLEHLMVYFIYTYFVGSVYDGKVYGKVKFATVSTLLIQELLLGQRAIKGKLEESDILWIAHSFSREMEHSDTNLATWERELREIPELTIEHITKTCLH